ncbi:hypothetical protein K435DRAFT_161113 [Dendrothele bispora CBS 962.96]|uniref:ABC transporter TMD0 domain-containing protein n=1 Tax=Dendrothele bispora (strain CBS 962.96) TaxID=1314807 RepID=A0A4S8MR04_DENBC|nr:hypothetical protein K435DRAFT_161113 [Dendrothele bispora CBS 962.96]
MLCTSRRFPLPGSPSTCTLDAAIVPLPSFCLIVILIATLRFYTGNERLVKITLYSRWLHIVYFVLVIAAFAMSLLEIARLAAEHLGVGLLPITPVALLIAMIIIWKERKTRTRTMASILAFYWLFLAIVQTVKSVRLHLLEELNPTTKNDSNYPSSDWFLDNVVMRV